MGTVRDRHAHLERGSLVTQGEVQSLELEHYPGMTEKAIEAMVDAAIERFDIYAARVVHRVGLCCPPTRLCWWR